MASFQSHYDVLGVSMSASPKEITTAYRKLALLNHPDKNKSDASATEKFKVILNSYETLKDTDTRRNYDADLPNRRAAWATQQSQHAHKHAQRRQRQSERSRKFNDLLSKRAQISRVIRLQEERCSESLVPVEDAP